MPEHAAHRRALVLLAIAVLAAHLWLLGAGQRLVQPVARAMPWNTRTIVPKPPAPAVAAEGPAPVTAAKHSPRGRPQGTQVARTPAAPAPAAQALAYVVPPAARLRYKVTAQGRGVAHEGEGLLSWKHDGHLYEAQLTTSAPLTRTQTSTGAVTAVGLEPQRFAAKTRTEEATHFQRDGGKLLFSSNRPEVPLQPGAQDRLSVMLQLGAMIAGAPHRYPAGTTVAIQTASTREAEAWTFSIDGMQTLELPGGTVEALKLTRLAVREYDVKVELWLAPGMAYVPVRLRLTQPNGDWTDHQWSSTDRG